MNTPLTPSDLVAFEDRIRAHWRAGAIPSLLHLCGGNEAWLCSWARDHYKTGDWVLSTHRNHYHALLAGIPPEQLEASILAGRSMFTFSARHRFLSSSILAGTCAIAVGLAHAEAEQKSGARVWCFLGDGAEEEGHFYEAALYAQAHGLPVTFIVEDNDRQVDTPRATRRPLPAIELWQIFPCVRRYTYTPTYPHAGDGSAAGTITFREDAIARLRACENKQPAISAPQFQ